MPFLDLLRSNQTVFGSVNASPGAFLQAVEDLGRMPRGVLAGMIRRQSFESLRDTLARTPSAEAKIVHVIRD